MAGGYSNSGMREGVFLRCNYKKLKYVLFAKAILSKGTVTFRVIKDP